MKDTVISASRKKFELWSMLACFIIAVLVNVYAIIKYSSPFKEIVTSIFYVLLFAIFLYIVWVLIRLIIKLISLLF